MRDNPSYLINVMTALVWGAKERQSAGWMCHREVWHLWMERPKVKQDYLGRERERETLYSYPLLQLVQGLEHQ